MRVTIIPVDRWIRRDDVSAKLPEWPFEDDAIHAIQWYGEEGEIEYTGRPKPLNRIIANPSILQPYLAALDAFLEDQASAATEQPPAP